MQKYGAHCSEQNELYLKFKIWVQAMLKPEQKWDSGLILSPHVRMLNPEARFFSDLSPT